MKPSLPIYNQFKKSSHGTLVDPNSLGPPIATGSFGDSNESPLSLLIGFESDCMFPISCSFILEVGDAAELLSDSVRPWMAASVDAINWTLFPGPPAAQLLSDSGVCGGDSCCQVWHWSVDTGGLAFSWFVPLVLSSKLEPLLPPGPLPASSALRIRVFELTVRWT